MKLSKVFWLSAQCSKKTISENHRLELAVNDIFAPKMTIYHWQASQGKKYNSRLRLHTRLQSNLFKCKTLLEKLVDPNSMQRQGRNNSYFSHFTVECDAQNFRLI